MNQLTEEAIMITEQFLAANPAYLPTERNCEALLHQLCLDAGLGDHEPETLCAIGIFTLPNLQRAFDSCRNAGSLERPLNIFNPPEREKE